MNHLSIIVLFMSVLLGATRLHAAITITAGDISAAATNPDSSDLGDKSITIGDLTITSTGTSPDDRNLGWETYGGGTVESIGVFEGNTSKHGAVGLGERLTLSFGTNVSLLSMMITDHGRDDGTAIISGFVSDPGASVSGLPTGWTVSFSSGAVNISSNNNSGYRSSYLVTFANPVDVTSLTISNPTFLAGGPGGVGFGSITYIPEPSSIALICTTGLLLMLRRRR